MTGTKDVLQVALSLRMPLWQRKDETLAREKIEQLEEYLLLTAYYEGELADERNRCIERLAKLDDEWEDIEHASYVLDRKVTEAQVERERRQEKPDLWRERKELQRRVARLWEEMERMERDTKRASRVYTFITGG